MKIEKSKKRKFEKTKRDGKIGNGSQQDKENKLSERPKTAGVCVVRGIAQPGVSQQKQQRQATRNKPRLTVSVL